MFDRTADCERVALHPPGPMTDAGISALAMELIPRITRAQMMHVLSSQAGRLVGCSPCALIVGSPHFGGAINGLCASS
ncbi:hypothetical protein GPL21_35745 [Bradyrhizobium pachyrhizi]|uniref:Uncharacterized protein n=1 Tax=Bradyrhizobium pachyrhizi TaxID=280333 RepID=A0A844T5S5_9BRAD|nr:hypothetical protein [Bradyrhizobium pachyrhizi]